MRAFYILYSFLQYVLQGIFKFTPLGNLRVSFRDSLASPVNGVYAPPVVVQVEDRDPTGVSLAGINYSGINKNNFGFINRETIAETGWIDLNNRFYMPELMRFGQTDPIIEGQEHLSLYQYGWNNPVLNSDPNGDCPSCPQGAEAAKVYATGAVVNNNDGSWTWTGSEWKDNNASPHSIAAGTQVMPEVTGFWGSVDQFWNGNRRFGDGREVNSEGILTDRYKPITGDPPGIGIGKIGTAIKIGGSFRKILGAYSWSSTRIAQAAKELLNGKTVIKVASRAEAEELFLGLFQGKGFKNTTGMSAKEAKDFIGKASTYHWDDAVDDAGRLMNHSSSNAHGLMKHLQIHDETGKIIRIFFE